MAFDTYLLDQALDQRRQKLEEVRQQTLQQTFALLDEVMPSLDVDRAYVFGSVLRAGRFHERSDVDVAVEAIEPEAFFALMSRLSSALVRDVDVMDLRKCHFAERVRETGELWTPNRI